MGVDQEGKGVEMMVEEAEQNEELTITIIGKEETYLELIDQVIQANPDLLPEEAREKILHFEEKYNHRIWIEEVLDDPDRKMISDRRRLSFLEGLNLAGTEEKKYARELREIFNSITQECTLFSNKDPKKIALFIDNAFGSKSVDTLQEAKEIFLNGPKIEGFNTKDEVGLDGVDIKEFLERTFTRELIRDCNLLRIEKNGEYQLTCDENTKAYTLRDKGLVYFELPSHMFAVTREDYLIAEMSLEGVENVEKLDHRFKLRALKGSENNLGKIILNNFEFTDLDSFDYLKMEELDSNTKKMKAYALGVVAHEVAHAYEHNLEDNIRNEYERILNTEVSPFREKYVTDYVMNHWRLYGSDQKLIFSEDFAETVRIYTTNPEYLKQYYPCRYSFIEDNIPDIKPGSVLEQLPEI